MLRTTCRRTLGHGPDALLSQQHMDAKLEQAGAHMHVCCLGREAGAKITPVPPFFIILKSKFLLLLLCFCA